MAAASVIRPRKKRRDEQLSRLSAEQFMASVPTSEEDEESLEKLSEIKPSKSSHKDQLNRLSEIDPEFFHFLEENDQQLLEFSDSEQESTQSAGEGDREEDEEEEQQEEEDECETDEEARDEDASRSCPSGGVPVTLPMVREWTEQLKHKHSLQALSQITSALHCGVVSMVTAPEGGNKERLPYIIRESGVFNALVVSCLRHLGAVLGRYVPVNPSCQPKSKQTLPVTNSSWKRVRGLVKPYLQDCLQLLSCVAEVTMICALLRHISNLWPFFARFPKLFRRLLQEAVRVWSEGDEEPRVLAFLLLRKVAVGLGEGRQQELLRKMHLNYVRHSRLTTLSTLPVIAFMCNCMVEMFALSPSLSYQLIFVYTRQLAQQLRMAYSAGGGKVKVGNWPYLHSLELFVRSLCDVPGGTLRPLLFPVTQVLLGTTHLLATAQFVPLRLHVVRLLVELTDKTGVFIPVSPLLLEILESHSGRVSGKTATGKPPELTCAIKLSKAQIGTRATQAAVLNCALDLLVRMLASSSHTISFPELSFPVIVRLRKIVKATPLSWLRQHLKTIIDKTEETASALTRTRSSLSFSPREQDKILLWERENSQRPNPLTQFQDKWQEIQHRNVVAAAAAAADTTKKQEVPAGEAKGRRRKRKRSAKEQVPESKLKRSRVHFATNSVSTGGENEDDVVEDLILSSSDDE